jgi:carboxyl-terminal processing protease
LSAVVLALFLVGAAVAAPARNGPAPAPSDDLLNQAQALEQRGDWPNASRKYDDLIRKNRGNIEARDGYHRCVRQYQILRRHSDRHYREALVHLQPSQALDIYEAVLTAIPNYYVERDKTEINALLKHGVQELRYALNQEVFVREYLKGATPGALEAFKTRLNDWPERKISNPADVRPLIQALAALAQQDDLVTNRASFTVVLALEFAYGACAGLDDYTLFLTPQHYTAIQAALHGKFVGVGIDLNDQLEITRIYPNSPAAEAGLLLRDRIVRIDQQMVKEMRPDEAAELLRGKPDSPVELEIAARPGEMMNLTFKLQRRAVVVPSVEWRMESTEDGDYIGVVKITHFQDTTFKEVQEALASVQSQSGMPIKGLILDLRGNPGGSFPAARKVAELFLPEGVIVNTTSQLKELKDKTFRVEGGVNPVTMPMCVLIDYETASSAELLAGALKENGDGRILLIGQTTFGKGSIQGIIPLKQDKALGGLRITIAKFTSPDDHPYANVGVTPHVPVNILGDGMMMDPFHTEAIQQFKNQLFKRMVSPMMKGPGDST